MPRKSPWFKIGPSYDLAVSPDGKIMAGMGRATTLWDIATRTQVGRFADLKHPSHLAFSHRGHALTVKNTSGRVALYDLQTKSLIQTFLPTGHEGANLFFSPDDAFLIDADWNGTIMVLDPRRKMIVFSEQFDHHMITFIDHVPGDDHYLFVVNPKASAEGRYKSGAPDSIPGCNCSSIQSYPRDDRLYCAAPARDCDLGREPPSCAARPS